MTTSASAIVGVSDHCGWAIFATVDGQHRLIDRRRVALVDTGLPALPHHHEAQALPVQRAVALVEKVRNSAAGCAARALHALSSDVSVDIVGIAMRRCPSLPPTVEERISSYYAQTRADSVMYRDALASAALDRGWKVHWYEPSRVFDDASRVLGSESIEDLLERTKALLGPPWRKDHKQAMAAAIAALFRDHDGTTV